jgi:hypothetical protein
MAGDAWLRKKSRRLGAQAFGKGAQLGRRAGTDAEAASV